MGQSYSMDLRERVAGFVEAGGSRRAAARQFAVGASFAVKLMQRVAASGSLAPGRRGRPPGRGKLAPYTDFLIATVEAEPDITMPELRDRLIAAHGVGVDPAALSRFLCRHGYSYKKNSDRQRAQARRHARGAPPMV